MKPILFLSFVLGLVMVPNAMAQQVEAPANTQDAQVAEGARVAIQNATDQLNQALLRGNVAGVLKWLAPDFELGRRQYRVRDLAWMKKALPLQFKRGRYTKLSVEVNGVKLQGGVALSDEHIDVEVVLKEGVAKADRRQESNIGGSGNSEWVQTVQGWRLQRGNSALEELVFLAAPPATYRKRLSTSPSSLVTIEGMPLQEPKFVVERRRGGFDTALAFSPDGKQLAFSFDSETIRLVSTSNGSLLHDRQVPKPEYSWIKEISYTRDGSLWTTDSAGRVRQWDSAATAVKWEWKVRGIGGDYQASIRADGGAFAVSHDNEVQLWDAAQDKPKLSFTMPAKFISDIDCSPDGRLVALTTSEGIQLRSAQDGALVHEFKDGQWGRFLPDHKTAVTMKLKGHDYQSSKDGEEVVSFRSLDGGEVIRELTIPMLRSQEEAEQKKRSGTGSFIFVYPRAVSRDGRFIARMHSNESIGIWDAQTGRLVRVLRGIAAAYRNVSATLTFSPDGRYLAEDSNQGEIAVWDVSSPAN